uniref:Uncharacterized protein n=1 Tax=Anopheles minimus TaxID=112268 RepID=A0A182WQ79_9DIPT
MRSLASNSNNSSSG